MSFKIIKKEYTLEKIVKQIKNQISKGILKSGEKLPSERKFADSLGVSRASVREAIQALSFSGYLKVVHGKGTYVVDSAKKYDEIVYFFSRLSDYSLDYLMEARIIMESELARLASFKSNEEDVKEIEKVYSEMVNSKDLNTFVVKDLEFHLTIAKATHNPIFDTIMKIFVEMLYKETQKMIEHSKDTKDKTIKLTYELVQAIKEHDGDRAKKLMSKHISSAKRFFKNNIDEL